MTHSTPCFLSFLRFRSFTSTTIFPSHGRGGLACIFGRVATRILAPFWIPGFMSWCILTTHWVFWRSTAHGRGSWRRPSCYSSPRSLFIPFSAPRNFMTNKQNQSTLLPLVFKCLRWSVYFFFLCIFIPRPTAKRRHSAKVLAPTATMVRIIVCQKMTQYPRTVPEMERRIHKNMLLRSVAISLVRNETDIKIAMLVKWPRELWTSRNIL